VVVGLIPGMLISRRPWLTALCSITWSAAFKNASTGFATAPHPRNARSGRNSGHNNPPATSPPLRLSLDRQSSLPPCALACFRVVLARLPLSRRKAFNSR